MEEAAGGASCTRYEGAKAGASGRQEGEFARTQSGLQARAEPETAMPEEPSGDDVEGDMINSELEQRMIDVDSGKRKLVSYPSMDAYIKHVKEVLNE